MKRLPAIKPGLLALALLLSPTTFSAETASDAARLKTALIYKLAKFVSWPPLDNQQFGICLLGDGELATTIGTLEGRRLSGKRVTVRRYSQSRSIDQQCQVVFITDSKKAFLADILGYFADKPVLTLSDTRNFARQGGMVEFRQTNNKVTFAINLKSARRSGLSISSQLLELATIVEK